MSKLLGLTAVACISGAVSSVAVVAPASLTVQYVVWHIWPYVLVIGLAILVPKLRFVWLGMALFPAFADSWVLAETILRTKSPVLMAMGLLAGLKAFLLLPIGGAFGALLHWRFQHESKNGVGVIFD